MFIENKFRLEQTAYLKTDKDQLPRLVTGIRLRPGDTILYDLSSGATESVHYEFEVDGEADLILTTTN